ncbi:MAG: hypothetical protein K2H64_11820 [Desulfovibrio sp.]|nr:hypothetical protein [Desulfovibrio sp.]
MLAIILTVCQSPFCFAADAEQKNAWSFGQSMDRGEAIWQKGVGASEIKQKALPPGQRGAVDTRKGIDRAVNDAIKGEPRSKLRLSMEKEESRWKAAPSRNSPRVDEDMGRERKRVFRAYADVQGGEDWSVTVGPELILKDEQYGDSSASSSEPDSAWGVGMKFKYDF